MTGHRTALAMPTPSYQVKLRRSLPIHAYIGGNGAGKTLAMVLDTLPTLAAGRTVLGTVVLLDPDTGKPHPQWEPLDEPAKLVDAYQCDVLLDEVSGVASSRASSDMPNIIENNLQQLRRGDVCIRWTAPSWKRADTIIRECSQGVTVCRSFARGQKVVEFSDGTERLWRSKSRMKWTTFDAQEFEEWSISQKDKLSPICRQRFNRLKPAGQYASASYDTFAPVLRWGLSDSSGRCIHCGKFRRREYCGGHEDVHTSHGGSSRLLEVAETDDTPGVLIALPDPANGVGSP